MGEQFGIDFIITAVATRRLGWFASPTGFDPLHPTGDQCRGIRDWLESGQPDVVFEAVALDPHRGEPALGYLLESLAAGAHVISANKGPVVHGYRQLARLARATHLQYRFESAVMDGAPVFSLVQRCLPLAGLRGVRGVFTSTATVVLEAMEQGLSLAEGVAFAQRMGIAESNPAHDVDGWDTAVKLCAIANVLFGGDLRPNDVEREGITGLDPAAIRSSLDDGSTYRLVGRIAMDAEGAIKASARPERLAAGDPLRVARGSTLAIHWAAEVFPGGLTVTSHDPDPTTTAYGMLADFIDVARQSPDG